MSNTSINETFIIEGIGEGPDFSACTAIFSNEIKSCTGNTSINLGENVIVFNGNLLAPSISATTFYGDGSNLTGVSTKDTFVTGGTYNNGTIIFTNNTGGTFSVSGFSVTTSFTGGTVTGSTIFTNGLTANTISATTYENVAHNSTTGLQGGSPAGAGEYYHLTASQNTRVLNLIYSGQVTTFSVSPTTAERGTATTVTASYRMIAGDDVYTSAVINPLGFNLYPTFTDGVARTTAFTQSTSANTITYTLNYGFTRNGVPNTDGVARTLTTFLPQWYGVNADFSAATNYTAVSALGLTKVIQLSAGIITPAITTTNKFVWFISNKSGATITANGFNVGVSPLNIEDGSEMNQKSFTMTLANGVTSGTLYSYISKEPKITTGSVVTP